MSACALDQNKTLKSTILDFKPHSFFPKLFSLVAAFSNGHSITVLSQYQASG